MRVTMSPYNQAHNINSVSPESSSARVTMSDFPFLGPRISRDTFYFSGFVRGSTPIPWFLLLFPRCSWFPRASFVVQGHVSSSSPVVHSPTSGGRVPRFVVPFNPLPVAISQRPAAPVPVVPGDPGGAPPNP